MFKTNFIWIFRDRVFHILVFVPFIILHMRYFTKSCTFYLMPGPGWLLCYKLPYLLSRFRLRWKRCLRPCSGFSRVKRRHSTFKGETRYCLLVHWPTRKKEIEQKEETKDIFSYWTLLLFLRDIWCCKAFTSNFFYPEKKEEEIEEILIKISGKFDKEDIMKQLSRLLQPSGEKRNRDKRMSKKNKMLMKWYSVFSHNVFYFFY